MDEESGQVGQGAPQYRVRIHWLGGWRPLSGRFRSWRRDQNLFKVDLFSSAADSGDGCIVALAGVVVTVLFALLAWFLLIPALLLIVDAVVVAVIAVAATIASELLGRPWQVSIESGGVEVAALGVRGWTRAQQIRRAIEVDLAEGMTPEQAVAARFAIDPSNLSRDDRPSA